MFKNLFKKNKDTDQLIYDIAEYKREEDRELFYRLFAKTKFICPVDPESLKHLPRGENHVLSAGSKLKIHATVIDGLKFAIFSTSVEGMTDAEMYFEIIGLNALELISETDALSGALIHNKARACVRLDMEQIKYILSLNKP
jgi:hypothetical protein